MSTASRMSITAVNLQLMDATDRCRINTLEDALLEQIFGDLPFEDRCSNTAPHPPLPRSPRLPADVHLLRSHNSASYGLALRRKVLWPGTFIRITACLQVEDAAARVQAVGTDPEAALCSMAADRRHFVCVRTARQPREAWLHNGRLVGDLGMVREVSVAWVN